MSDMNEEEVIAFLKTLKDVEYDPKLAREMNTYSNNIIDMSEWKTENPKLFEYDKNNNIVDIFVKADLTCPFPFHKDDWYHQGFYLQSFITYLKLFLEKHNLPYEVILKSELEDLKLFTTPPSLTQKEIDMIRGYGEED